MFAVRGACAFVLAARVSGGATSSLSAPHAGRWAFSTLLNLLKYVFSGARDMTSCEIRPAEMRECLVLLIRSRCPIAIEGSPVGKT